MNPYAEKITRFFLLAPILWAFTGMFWLPKGISLMGGLCVITTLLLILRCHGKNFSINIKSNHFLWLLLLYIAYACISRFYHGYSSREIKALIFACAYVLFLPPEILSTQTIRRILLLAAIGIFATALYQHHILNIDRINGFINPITYATFAATCSIALFTYALHHPVRYIQLLLFSGSSMALIGTVLTGTRGVMLAVGISGITLLYLHSKTFTASRRKLIRISTIILLILAAVTIYPLIKGRVIHTQHEIGQITRGDYESSFGQRIQMWRSGLRSIGKAPVFGLGDNYMAEFSEQHQQKLITKSLYAYQIPHYHNQYLDKLIKNGLTGLILLLLLLGYPLYMALKTRQPSTAKFNIIGLTIILFVSGLTDVPLNHAPTLYYFIFLTVFYLHTLKNPEAQPHNRL